MILSVQPGCGFRELDADDVPNSSPCRLVVKLKCRRPWGIANNQRAVRERDPDPLRIEASFENARVRFESVLIDPFGKTYRIPSKSRKTVVPRLISCTAPPVPLLDATSHTRM